MGELSTFYKKDAAEKTFPFEFAKELNIKAVYPNNPTLLKNKEVFIQSKGKNKN